MTQRTEQLRRAIIEAEPRVCAERAVLMTEAYRKTEGFPSSYRRADAFRHILERMNVYIQEGELIVGNYATSPRAAPVFPEFSIQWLLKELETMASRAVDPFVVLDTDAKNLREIATYWMGKTHEDHSRRLIEATLDTDYAQHYKNASLNQVTYNSVNLSAGQGHVIPDYATLLQRGFIGIIEEARAKMATLDRCKKDFEGVRADCGGLREGPGASCRYVLGGAAICLVHPPVDSRGEQRARRFDRAPRPVPGSLLSTRVGIWHSN
ncbi:MAG: pyruvate formate-lyase [candidate division NC10 bacterium]|nr:pyruvate formate-lyase [candidate division NC10 bacterium]